MARPKPSRNSDDNNNDDDNVDVEMTVLDEPSVEERPQPGAFPIAGPEGALIRSSSGSSGSGDDEALDDNFPVRTRDLDTLELERPVRPRQGPLHRNVDDVSTVVLLEANLVIDLPPPSNASNDNANFALLVEGQAIVEPSAAERTREQRRRYVRIFVLVLLAVGINTGIAVGTTLTMTSNTPVAHSGLSNPSLRQLFDSLPNHTTMLLQNTRSPQYKAWSWLTLLDDTLNMELWKLRQRFALACFRFATTAFESYIDDPFSPLDLDECNWNGIVCQENGSVMEIALSHRYLLGSVPRELFFLSKLTALYLASNYDLEGTLSSDLQHLSNLEVFNLSATALTGSIPTQLGRLSSLILLDLSYAFITGILPTHLGQLPNLRRLNLTGNSLSGPIPTHLGNLSSSLRWLDLNYNYLNGSLPSELGHLTQLEHLDLSYNYQLSGRVPTELGLLSQLTHLDFDSFSGSIPTEIGQLTRLESLFLGVVNGTVPTELGLLSQLKNLELTVQSVTGRFPTELSQLPLLESLEIKYSKNGTIPAEVGLMSRLTDLAMWGATGPIPTTFGQLKVLESLTLTDQSLMGSIPSELGQLSALTYLKLSFNDALTGTIPTDFFGLLSNLTDLYISNFNGTIPTELGLLSNLQELWLSGSCVNGSIPTELGLLSELTMLGLSYKELTGTIPTELGRLSNLETLYLESSLVTGSVPFEICQLASIAGGVLSDMSINCAMVSCSCGVCFCD